MKVSIRLLDNPGKMKRLIIIKQNNTKATATADDKCTLKRPVIQYGLQEINQSEEVFNAQSKN